MAQQRTARLVAAENINANTRLLEFSTEEEIGFTGGQYIIVHTGVPIGEGKTAKRAYSLLSSDEQQHGFQVAVRGIGTGADPISLGPGSNFMLNLSIGSELAFSGPWGKFLPAEISPDGTASSSTLVLATDTGITAALGLVQSRKFLPYRERATIFWLTGQEDYFLSESLVRERIARLCRTMEILRIPVDPMQRGVWLQLHKQALLERMLAERPATAYLSGDGFLLAEFRDALLQAAAEPPAIFVETFFHHQEFKSVAKATV